MLIQNRVTVIASGGSASPKTMKILAEGAKNQAAKLDFSTR